MGATDEFGFTALPGGLRYTDGSFRNRGDTGYWYAAPEESSENLPGVAMVHDRENIDIGGNPSNNGVSVRCVKD